MTATPKVLSLDGGGIRGISSLQILEALMQKIREDRNMRDTPRPCEIFDIIGGTSTGGIIAIMLGRLGMTVADCLKAYRVLGEKAFTPKVRLPFPGPPKGAFSSKALKAAIQEAITSNCREHRCIVTKRCHHADDIFQDTTCTKTVVLAATKQNMSAKPTLFKTYARSDAFQGCTIWEVALATSAATTFFKSVKVGRDRIEFVDAALGFNNPSEVLLEEAHRVFPEARRMCLLSIGTGLGGIVSIRDTRTSIITMLKKIGTESNKVADRLEERFQGTNQYFRFNVDRGLEDITLADWRMDSDISTHTHNYLKTQRIQMANFVSSLDAEGTKQCEQNRGQEEQSDQSNTRSPEAITPFGLSIVGNSVFDNAEQSNSIANMQTGRSAAISENVARDRSKQWNSITA